MTPSITAIVLAGGPNDELSKRQTGAANKAFLQIAGIPLVTRVLRALRSSSMIDRIIVVAPHHTHAESALELADERRDDGTKIRDSLSSGLKGLDPDLPVLVSASDLPLLTPESIDDFVGRAYRANGELNYGCVEKSIHLTAYPNVPHTWVHLRDGTYCGGGFVVLRPRVFPLLEQLIERLGAARKSPLRLATLFGFSTLLRYATRRLRIADCERRAEELLGAPARAIISPYANTAVNVDRVSDIALAETLVNARTMR